MSDQGWLMLIGAAIALVSSIIGAVVNHFLSLRAARKTRELGIGGAMGTAGPMMMAELPDEETAQMWGSVPTGPRGPNTGPLTGPPQESDSFD